MGGGLEDFNTSNGRHRLRDDEDVAVAGRLGDTEEVAEWERLPLGESIEDAVDGRRVERAGGDGVWREGDEAVDGRLVERGGGEGAVICFWPGSDCAEVWAGAMTWATGSWYLDPESLE